MGVNVPSRQFNYPHLGLTVWFTGLSGAGKSTLARSVHAKLLAGGFHTELLDADVLRKSLNCDLGYSKEDRDENVRRLGFVANLLTRHGVIVLVAAISPYRAAREELRRTIPQFIEVHVDATLTSCEARDPKGLYRKARQGEIRGFTGIDDPYETPIAPEVWCRSDRESVDESVKKVFAAILAFVNPPNP